MEFVYRGLVRLKVKNRWRTCIRYDAIGRNGRSKDGLISLDKKWMRPCDAHGVKGQWHRLSYQAKTQRYQFPDPSGVKDHWQVYEELIDMVDQAIIELELLGVSETIITRENV